MDASAYEFAKDRQKVIAYLSQNNFNYSMV